MQATGEWRIVDEKIATVWTEGCGWTLVWVGGKNGTPIVVWCEFENDILKWYVNADLDCQEEIDCPEFYAQIRSPFNPPGEQDEE